MKAEKQIKSWVIDLVKELYQHELVDQDITVKQTPKNFVGQYTIVVFPFTRFSKKSPPQTAEELGEKLKLDNPLVKDFSVEKGFLNLDMEDAFWIAQLQAFAKNPEFWRKPKKNETFIVEFSSPNTNKPLHLGHIRNILLGWSMSQILEIEGYDVFKTQVVNDRGIAICKSMLAWNQFADGKTPESEGIKSDHFVGDWYVKFNQELANEYEQWQNSNEGEEAFEEHGKDQSKDAFFKSYSNKYFNIHSAIGKQAREYLLKWENGDPEIKALWEKMNNWVYAGFETTYKNLGVSFDGTDYESQTYLLGKSVVEKGLQADTFYKEADGSIWVNLEDVGLDKKIVLRSDGTSVYITQDIGTAMERYKDQKFKKMIYVVGDEQEYHFKVLFEILKKLDEPYVDGMYHLSYGMVDLPTGKMKSREGTVVDADVLMEEVVEEARKAAEENGAIEDLNTDEKSDVLRKIGMGALKFFMIKINPKKRMVFDPKQSVDMQGQTGPYIQNAYVRIQSILRKTNLAEQAPFDTHVPTDLEKEILAYLGSFSKTISMAADTNDPSLIANYAYQLAKNFHRFYHEHRILNADTEAAISFRLELSNRTAIILAEAMRLLGIEMPERM